MTEQLNNSKTGVQLTNNTMTVSDEQRSDSAILHMYPFSPKTPPSSRLPHNTEQSSVCYSRYLLIIHFKYSNVYMPSPNLSFSMPPPP